MHWRIKLEDQHGHFWLTEKRNMWSDRADDAFRFTCEDKAREVAVYVKSTVAEYIDWFPRVKVVRFLDS